jgi:hypothetical protein
MEALTLMKPEELNKRQLMVAGWPANITSYRVGSSWHCTVDNNVSPGAVIARTLGASRGEVENKALDRAEELLRHTKVQGRAAVRRE